MNDTIVQRKVNNKDSRLQKDINKRAAWANNWK